MTSGAVSLTNSVDMYTPGPPWPSVGHHLAMICCYWPLWLTAWENCRRRRLKQSTTIVSHSMSVSYVADDWLVDKSVYNARRTLACRSEGLCRPIVGSRHLLSVTQPDNERCPVSYYGNETACREASTAFTKLRNIEQVATTFIQVI